MLEADAAVAAVPRGSRIYIEGGPGHPTLLAGALVEHARSHGPFEVVTSVMGPTPAYCLPDCAGLFYVKSFRGSAQTREAYLSGQLDVVPVGLSAIPGLLSGSLRPDVALVQMSEPDDGGWCSLGASVLYHPAAIAAARLVIAEVNPGMPRTFGDGSVHVSRVGAIVSSKNPLIEYPAAEPTADELAVARHIAEFVENGATVQVGMGGFARAVARELRSRRNLRLHAGLLSDGVLDLMDAGAIADLPGAVTTGALAGTSKLYQAADGNPMICVRRVEYTHNPQVLQALPSFVAINSALEVDFTGQINGESLRGMPVSGAGGALDFARGAIAGGGLSIVGLTSMASSARVRRIVPELASPVTVTIPRTDVDILVTEHGAVDLRGLGLRARAHAISSIAGTPTGHDGGEEVFPGRR
jgi:acyl-CoA hydrolase